MQRLSALHTPSLESASSSTRSYQRTFRQCFGACARCTALDQSNGAGASFPRVLQMITFFIRDPPSMKILIASSTPDDTMMRAVSSCKPSRAFVARIVPSSAVARGVAHIRRGIGRPSATSGVRRSLLLGFLAGSLHTSAMALAASPEIEQVSLDSPYSTKSVKIH